MKTEVSHDIKIHEFKKGILHLPVGTVFLTEHGALWVRSHIDFIAESNRKKFLKLGYDPEGATHLETGNWLRASRFSGTRVIEIKGSFVHEPLLTFPEL